MKKTLLLLALVPAGLLMLGTTILFHSNVSSAQTPENPFTDQKAIAEINSYLTTDYIQLYDEDQDIDPIAQLEKLAALERQLAKSQDGLPAELALAAQTMITQLKTAMYHDQPQKADYYIDQYLRFLYSPSSASSQYDALHLYSAISGDESINTVEDWKQLSENDKISLILSMKRLALSQEAVQYAPSTFYLYKQLEKQSEDANVSNKMIQLLFQ
ncbi:MAG: hypothetical protein ACI33P_07125 [Lysinibacillus sp.]